MIGFKPSTDRDGRRRLVSVTACAERHGHGGPAGRIRPRRQARLSCRRTCHRPADTRREDRLGEELARRHRRRPPSCGRSPTCTARRCSRTKPAGASSSSSQMTRRRSRWHRRRSPASRLWNKSARAGCDGQRPRKPSAFPAVAQVDKGHGWLCPRTASRRPTSRSSTAPSRRGSTRICEASTKPPGGRAILQEMPRTSRIEYRPAGLPTRNRAAARAPRA